MSEGLDLCRFPAKLANYSDMSAEVQVQAQIPPIFCSQLVFRPNLTHWAKKKGGKIFASKDLVRHLHRGLGGAKKDLVRGLVCKAKMYIFWKPWKHGVWTPSEHQELFSIILRGVLSSFMAWDAGGGLWWAATAEIFSKYAIIAHLLKHLSDTTPFFVAY